ncbi:hypothetical protein ACWTU6_30250 [Mesorhizobium sp. BHbsci]
MLLLNGKLGGASAKELRSTSIRLRLEPLNTLRARPPILREGLMGIPVDNSPSMASSALSSLDNNVGARTSKSPLL